MDGATPQRVLTGNDPGPGSVLQKGRGFLGDPARQLEGLVQTAAVEDEPLTAVTAGVQAGQGGREQVERTAHGVEQDQVSSTAPSNRFEPSHRVTQHLQHVSPHHEVDLAHLGRVQVVDIQVAELGSRPEQLGSESEVLLRRATEPTAGQSVGDRVVEPVRVGYVTGDDRVRTSSFQLESPKAVHGAYVETTHTG